MGRVIENSKWIIKIYPPPREHGPPHVHVIAKGVEAEVKIKLETLEVIGKTRFSKGAINKILTYISENYDHLMEVWEEMHEKE